MTRVTKVQKIWPDRLPPESNAISYYNRALLALTGQCISHDPEFFCGPDDIPNKCKEMPEWFESGYLSQPDFDPSSNQVVKFLADNQQAIQFIDQGVSCPGLYYELNTKRLHRTRTPRFYYVRPLWKLKRLQALSKAHNGKIHGALDDLARIERLADQLLHCPSIYSSGEAELISEYGY